MGNVTKRKWHINQLIYKYSVRSSKSLSNEMLKDTETKCTSHKNLNLNLGVSWS